MSLLLWQIKPRSLIAGLISFLPGVVSLTNYLRGNFQFFKKGLRPNDFGYHVLRQRLEDLGEGRFDIRDKVYLEVAPGHNFSNPISAIAMGAKHAIGIDAFDYTNFSDNQDILDAVCSYTEVSEGRRKAIQNSLEHIAVRGKSELFSYYAPWRTGDIELESVDLVTSLSTMEHVQDPDKMYASIACWLKPQGYMVNKIDFSSHNSTKSWFGHYILPTWLWGLIQGKKFGYLNRWKEQQHIRACEDCGFTLISRIPFFSEQVGPGSLADHPVVAVHVWQKNK